MKKVINSSNAPGAIGPYSQAIEAGRYGFFVFRPSCPLMPQREPWQRVPKPKPASRCENIKQILAEAGLSMGHIVKTTVFLADMSLFADMNKVYATYFDGDYPARSAVAVKELPKGALVEIECIAVR